MAIVVLEPVVEGPLADVLHGLEHADGDQFAYELDGLAMVRGVSQDVVCLVEQFGDKIGDVREVPAVGSAKSQQVHPP